MQTEVEISLNSFYVFNPTFGAKEGEVIFFFFINRFYTVL